jgi:hypothetical protein
VTGQQLAPTTNRSATTQTLREQFAPNATDTELSYFAAVAAHLELDPWAGHIVMLPHWDKKLGHNVYRPTMTVAGRRFIAERSGRLRGIDGPQWCGPRATSTDGSRGPLEWLDVWDGDGEPYAARVLVYVAGWELPVNGTVKWDEFAQRYQTEPRNLLPTWEQMPSHMLGKTAESLALRRAFPEVAAAVAFTGPEDGDEGATITAEVSADVLEPEVVENPPPADRAPAPIDLEPDRPPARRKARPDAVPDWVRDQDPENRPR